MLDKNSRINSENNINTQNSAEKKHEKIDSLNIEDSHAEFKKMNDIVHDTMNSKSHTESQEEKEQQIQEDESLPTQKPHYQNLTDEKKIPEQYKDHIELLGREEKFEDGEVTTFPRLLHVLDKFFTRSSGVNSVTGNRIKLLIDSKENFPRWIDAIKNAEKEICIEMYIFDKTPFAKEVRDLLIKKAEEGVHVYFIYDWWGSLKSALSGFFYPMEEAGIEVLPFNKLGIFKGFGFLSRNHRKSIIIDQSIAFVSGLCISSTWEGNPKKNIDPWRDTGVELEGPIVDQVYLAFWQTYHTIVGRIPDEIYYIPSKEVGSETARIIATTPENTNMVRVDLGAIGIARRSLWITDAYFMPTKMYMQALINASLDGVDVRILVPGTGDIGWIKHVSQTYYRKLLEAGVRVFEWNGTMLHAKTAIVDSTWARVGSTNLNYSSWYNNRELDVVLESKHTVQLLCQQFLKDLENSTEIILDEEPQEGHNWLQGSKSSFLSKENMNNLKDINKFGLVAAGKHVRYLGRKLGNILRGEELPVEQSELSAYVSLSILSIILFVLIFIFPSIIYVPVLLTLFGIISVSLGKAFRISYRLRKNKKNK